MSESGVEKEMEDPKLEAAVLLVKALRVELFDLAEKNKELVDEAAAMRVELGALRGIKFTPTIQRSDGEPRDHWEARVLGWGAAVRLHDQKVSRIARSNKTGRGRDSVVYDSVVDATLQAIKEVTSAPEDANKLTIGTHTPSCFKTPEFEEPSDVSGEGVDISKNNWLR